MERLIPINRIREIIIGCTFALISSLSLAQQEEAPIENPAIGPLASNEENGVEEELFVTGTYIRGLTQEDMASPLLSIGRDAIQDIGAVRIADITNSLTINTGSQNNTDAFTQNFTTGTSNVNLRGLGVASTLVLLNGRRQTYAAFATNDGANFVDTGALVPMIAIDRLEILKDGATSLYGSDAVAGVVNFITRDNFEGIEIEVEGLSADAGANDLNLSGLFGFGNERTHFIGAFSYLDRDSLGTDDRRLSLPEDDTSRAGFPGTFLVPTTPTTAGLGPTWTAVFDSAGTVPGLSDFFEALLGAPAVPNALQPAIADLDCAALAAGDNTTIPPDTFPIGPCEFDFGSFFSIVPEEERNQVYASITHELSDSLEFFAELGFASNSVKRRNSPSFPITTTPLICGDGSLDAALGGSCAALGAHPDNPFGVDVLFIGRVMGSGADALISRNERDTTRLAFALNGELSNSWSWTVDLTSSEDDSFLSVDDTLATEFQNALVGLGGSECVGTIGVDIFPGVGPCSFFNPFGSSLTGTGTANSQAIFDYITGQYTIDAIAELTTLSGVISGELFDLAGGSASIAVGAQIRDEKLDYDYDENSNNENFLFLAGNPDFNADRDIKAAFVEFALPASDTVNIQLSARYEDYEDAGDSTDPKVAVLWRPSDSLSVRGSFTTSFRAPSLYQQNGIQTSLEEITVSGTSQFRPARSLANANDPLEPEEADIINLGFSWMNSSETFDFNLDYWSFDYSDVIVRENSQAIVDAFLAGDPSVATQVDTNASGIALIRVFYDNASSLETDGIDLKANYTWPTTSTGLYRVGIEMTQVMSYDIVDPVLGSVDGLGQRNFTNSATSVPETRANLSFLWSYNDRHSANAFVRYIDSYADDQNANTEIDSHTTLDLQYNYRFDPIGTADDGILLSVGGINVTDEDPPRVATNGGFDSKVHDPRGAVYYVRATIPF